MTVNRGTPSPLYVQWSAYQGGPVSAMTGVQITISRIGGPVVLGPTAAGVSMLSTGFYLYTWTPDVALPLQDYLVTWTGVDGDGDTVSAYETVTLIASPTLGGPYALAADVKRRASVPDTNGTLDTDVAIALASSSDVINQYTGRQFGRTDVATLRMVASRQGYLDTDDFWTTDGLVINGVAWVDGNTAWALEPSDGVLNGVPGYPYERISRYYQDHPIYATAWSFASRVPVYAKWGWAAVPGSITQACLLLAADHLKSKDTPFGVAGFGDYVVRVRANPKVQELLDPYRRDALKVA